MWWGAEGRRSEKVIVGWGIRGEGRREVHFRVRMSRAFLKHVGKEVRGRGQVEDVEEKGNKLWRGSPEVRGRVGQLGNSCFASWVDP